MTKQADPEWNRLSLIHMKKKKEISKEERVFIHVLVE